MAMREHSPPYLHTRYLSVDQQARCEQNPTYASQLANLCELHVEVHRIRGLLSAQEVGKLPEFAGKPKRRRPTKDPEEVEKDKEALKELEQKMLDWDDELAGLAEALLNKPKVGEKSQSGSPAGIQES